MEILAATRKAGHKIRLFAVSSYLQDDTAKFLVRGIRAKAQKLTTDHLMVKEKTMHSLPKKVTVIFKKLTLPGTPGSKVFLTGMLGKHYKKTGITTAIGETGKQLYWENRNGEIFLEIKTKGSTISCFFQKNRLAFYQEMPEKKEFYLKWEEHSHFPEKIRFSNGPTLVVTSFKDRTISCQTYSPAGERLYRRHPKAKFV